MAHDSVARSLFPSPGTPGEGQGGGRQNGNALWEAILRLGTNEPPPQPSPGVPGEGECAAPAESSILSSTRTTTIAAPPLASRSPALIRWFLNPYVQIGLGALTVTTSELLMKAGANATAARPTIAGGWLGIVALTSLWTWAGILCYIISFLSWIYVLRSVPLGIAYALINVAHVLIPIGSWAFLHEAIGPGRWCGIGLVVLGLCLLVGPVAKVEAKL